MVALARPSGPFLSTATATADARRRARGLHRTPATSGAGARGGGASGSWTSPRCIPRALGGAVLKGFLVGGLVLARRGVSSVRALESAGAELWEEQMTLWAETKEYEGIVTRMKAAVMVASSDLTIEERDLLISAMEGRKTCFSNASPPHPALLHPLYRRHQIEERDLLLSGYRNVLGPRRHTWRTVKLLEMSNSESELSPEELAEIKSRVESEVTEICEDMLLLLQEYLIPAASSPESRSFYMKVEGDHYRYLSEFLEGDRRAEAVEGARAAYTASSAIAEAHLPPSHSARLELALSMSVFCYEILDSPERACEMARTAFDNALHEMESHGLKLTDDRMHASQSTLCMQLLRDNLLLWSTFGSFN